MTLPGGSIWRAARSLGVGSGREHAEPEQGSPLGCRAEPEVEKNPANKGNCVSCVIAAVSDAYQEGNGRHDSV